MLRIHNGSQELRFKPVEVRGAPEPRDKLDEDPSYMINYRDDALGTPRFKDRREAAVFLARTLERYRDRKPLILGIPRGGLIMAEVLARMLGGDLDVALVRKLRAPGHSELAIGSVTEQGLIIMNEGWENLAPESYLKAETAEALKVLR